MQQTILKLELLDAIKNQTDGFRLGEIWRISNKSLGVLIPILRHKEFKRNYLLIEELKQDEYEVVDSGDISKLKIKGKFTKPVFIRTGNMFEGVGTQSRASEFSIVILPTKEKEIEVPVKCVHSSHPIRASASFRRYGYAPREVTYSLFSGEGQSAVWNSVNTSSKRLFRMANIGGSASDSMVKNLNQIKQDKSKISDIVKKVPCLENQVGVIILDESGVSNIELFNHHNSWKAFHESIIESYTDILSRQLDEPLFDIKKEVVPKKIVEFIEKIKNTEEKEVFNEKYASTILIRNNNIIGEYTSLNSEVIHLLASRKEKIDTQPERSAMIASFGPSRWNVREKYSAAEREPLIIRY